MSDEQREIFAWLGTEPDTTNEGIVMVPDNSGNPFPLVTTSAREAAAGQHAFRDFIVEAARRRGAPVRLVRYIEADVIAEVQPGEPI
jgi:hypothetical protein